jgi:LysM repeat protein
MMLMLRLGMPLMGLMLAGPGEVVVRPGETLPQVARRALGDEASASELRALNRLTGDEVAEGTAVKLPGPERDFASSTLKTARAAVSQAGVPEAKREAARGKLKEAETHFAQARYTDATRAADEAWQLVSEGKPSETVFTVKVDKDGSTQVKSVSGTPVRVEAQGRSQPLYVGQQVQVKKGEPPPAPVVALPAPVPVKPAAGAELALQPGKAELVLTWEPVAGATAYEVVLAREGGKELVVRAPKPETKLTTLKAGRYHWTVRAVAEERRSEPSERRAFVLQQDLSIQVGGWK